MALGAHLIRLASRRSSRSAGPHHRNRLQFMAAALFSSQAGLPFEVSGSCQALVYRRHGVPHEALQLEHGRLLQRSEVTADASSLVYLGMLAAPINPSDLNQIQGTYPLKSRGDIHVGGNEGVAVVLAVGEAVRGLNPGDWVIPKVGGFGTWREQVVCLEADLQKIPRAISIPVAATLKVNPPTAYRLLRDFGSLKQGDVIVQNGANSAVGRYVIQMAKHMGIRTINIIRDRPHYEALERELRELGATAVVKSELFSGEQTQAYLRDTLGLPRPVLGLNCVGGTATSDMARCLAEGATIVTYGGMAGKNPVASAASMIFRDIRYCGFWMSRWYQMAATRPDLQAQCEQMLLEIVQLYQQGVLAEPRTESFKFKTQWKEAIQRYTSPSPHSPKTGDAKPMLVFDRQP